jgi:hypothetical protein
MGPAALRGQRAWKPTQGGTAAVEATASERLEVRVDGAA